ncbi:NADP-dependent malic enzyme, partial [mine drainage metagenome]
MIGALMLARGEADAMICGMVGRFQKKLEHLLEVLPLDPGISAPAAMSAVANDKGLRFSWIRTCRKTPAPSRSPKRPCRRPC